MNTIGELKSFIESGRLAEAYTNRDHYEKEITEMQSMSQDLRIYEGLSRKEEQDAGINGLMKDRDYLEMRQSVLSSIETYVQKNLMQYKKR